MRQVTIALWGHTRNQCHTELRQVTIALWEHTKDQHQTELRQDEAGYNRSMGTHKEQT